MRKFCLLIVIILICFVSFCSCDTKSNDISDKFFQPSATLYGERVFANKNATVFSVYVCGAVQNEGYVFVKEGSSLADVVTKAGIIDQTVMPTNPNLIVKSNSMLAINYNDGGGERNCNNLNGTAVKLGLSVEGVPDEIVQKISHYLNTVGKISNKDILRQILTADEYQSNYYKFYVGEMDYEANS